jgi:hypothetical protein
MGVAWEHGGDHERAAGARIRQTAIFDPHGLVGLLYWYALLPLHRLIFSGMLRGIATAAASPAEPARAVAPKMTHIRKGGPS